MAISDDEDDLHGEYHSSSYEDSDDNGSHKDDTLDLPLLYHCTKCSFQTLRRYKLKEHFISCNPRRKNEVVPKKDILTSGRRFKCEYCDFRSINLNEYKKHKENHADLISGGLIECSQCDATFFTLKECKKHLQSIHEDNPAEDSGKAAAKKTKCTYCDLVDVSKKVIYNHTKQYHRLEKCTTCHVVIRGMYQLLLHDFLIHKNTKVVPSWNLRCVLCCYEGDIYSCYEHSQVHLKKKVTFKIIFQNLEFGFVNLHRTTIQKSDLPKVEQKKSNTDKTKKETVRQSKPRRFKCAHCEFTSKFRRAVNIHTTTFHQSPELTCSICETTVKGEFKLSCHTYLIHSKGVKNFSKWLLKCTHCQYQGNATQSYKHGKEHAKEMVSFRALLDGKRELATFRYSSQAKNIIDAVLKEFEPNAEESDNDYEESGASKKLAETVKKFQCPVKYCLFDCENKDDMKKHLKSVHNIIKKSELESKLQMSQTSESKDKSKPGGQRWYCFTCFDESTTKENAYVHGWSHGKPKMSFLTYDDHKLVGSVKFTYLTGNKCSVCKYTASNSKKLCEHNAQELLVAYSKEVVTNDSTETPSVNDSPDTESVNRDHLCAKCGHKAVTAFQMGVHQSLAHSEGKKRVFCPSEYCCFETKNPELLKNHLLQEHELTEGEIEKRTKQCPVEVVSSQIDEDKLSRSHSENGSNKRKLPEAQLSSKEHQLNDSWVTALESDILQDDDLSDQDYSEVIRIEVVNQDEKPPELPKNSALRIKCQNPGCSYYCLNDVKSMLAHAQKCSKKIKKEPSSPQAKRIKIDHTQPGKVTYKCWMCGVTLVYRGSLKSHTYVHAKEDNNFNLKIRFTVYKGETKQDTLVIQADPNFVPRSSSNYPLYTKTKQMRKPQASLEYNPSLPVFSCEQCNFKTNLKDALEKHIKLHWNAEKEAAYKSGNWFTCGICYYHCFDSKTFKEHGEMHKNRPVSKVRKVAKDSWTF